MIKKENYLLLIPAFTLITFITLFLCRQADTNMLVRWSWVFENLNFIDVLLIMFIGVVFAYALSSVSFFESYPSGFLFLLSFLWAVSFWGEPDFNVDTSRYFIQAKHLEVYGAGYFFREWGNNIFAWTDSPLLPFLYGLIFRFFGEEKIYIQVLTTLMFSLTVVLTYMIGKTLWDEKIGFYAGLLLLGIPYIFTQVPLMMVDIGTMFFFTLAIFTYITAMERGSLSLIIISAFTVFLALFVKYSTWPMFSILLIILFVYMKKDSRIAIRSGGLIAFIAAMLAAPIVILKYDVILEQIKVLVGYQKPVMDQWNETYISIFLFQVHPFITILSMFSVYIAIKKKDLKYIIISYLLILMFIFKISLMRYTIPIFPMLALMASYGLNELRSIRARRLIALSVVTFSFILSFHVFLPFLKQHNSITMKNAGELLNSLNVEEVEVYTLPQLEGEINPAVAVPLLDLATQKRILYNYQINSGFGPRLSEEKMKMSLVRFSWEYKNPEFYETNNNNISEDNTAVVVVSSMPDQALPDYVKEKIKNRSILKIFNTPGIGMFDHKAIVSIYK